MKTLYDRLGVTPQASLKAIQQSFFRKAKQFDPDNPANKGNADARLQYLAVHDAYRTLSDPEARRKYDRTLQMESLTMRVKAARTMRTLSRTLIVMLAMVIGGSFYFKYQPQRYANTASVAAPAQAGTRPAAADNVVTQQDGAIPAAR